MIHTQPTSAETTAAASADRVADVLLAMETQPALGFRLTPALADPAGGVVEIGLGDQVHVLSPDETLTLAHCVRWDDPGPLSQRLASRIEEAAQSAAALTGAGA